MNEKRRKKDERKKANEKKEPDPETVYADIFYLPHHQSDTRPRMSLYDRAAQFAPFAALSGYEEMIGEAAEAALSEQST